MSCSCSTTSTSDQELAHISHNKSECTITPTINAFEDIKIADILCKIEQGKLLLENYKKGQLLQPADRTMIVHKIIHYFIEHNIKLTVPKVQHLSEQIIELFPTENQSTYFFGRGKKHLPPKGKLWDRYRSQIRYRNLTKLSTLKKKEPKKVAKLATEKKGRKMKEICCSTDVLPEDEQKKMAIAITTRANRDWDDIVDIWKQTVQYRRNNLDKIKDSPVNLIQIIMNWKYYTFNRAPELVDIDFDCLITEKEKFTQKWQHFFKVAPALFKIRIKDTAAIQNLAEFFERETNLTADTIAFQCMHLLHAVLKPTTTYINNQRKKYSISDSQASFTVFVKNTYEVENVLLALRRIHVREETCLPPTIVLVGDHFNVKKCYVALSDIQYPFDSYVAALEYCFKLYYVLNVPYPRECSLVWRFVQEYLFGIKIEGLEVYPTLETLIGDINSLQCQSK